MPRKHVHAADYTPIESRLAEMLPSVEQPFLRQLLNLGHSYLSHGQVKKAQAAIWSASEASTTSALRGELEQMARELRA